MKTKSAIVEKKKKRISKDLCNTRMNSNETKQEQEKWKRM